MHKTIILLTVLLLAGAMLTGCATTTHPDGTVESRLDTESVIVMLDVLKNDVPEMIDRWNQLQAKLDEDKEPDIRQQAKEEILRHFLLALRARAAPD